MRYSVLRQTSRSVCIIIAILIIKKDTKGIFELLQVSLMSRQPCELVSELDTLITDTSMVEICRKSQKGAHICKPVFGSTLSDSETSQEC